MEAISDHGRSGAGGGEGDIEILVHETTLWRRIRGPAGVPIRVPVRPHCGPMSYLAAVVAGGLAVLAFPPFGVWPFVLVGPAAWLVALRRERRIRHGFLSGLLMGLVFFGGYMWWMMELGAEAVTALTLVQALYTAVFGAVVVRLGQDMGPMAWWVLTSGTSALTEFVKYRFPVGGLEWGAWGYALSDQEWARAAARWVGTSGWTVLIVAVAGGLAAAVMSRRWTAGAAPLALFAALGVAGWLAPDVPSGRPLEVAVVQGSTPCPYEDCVDERLRTYVQHLVLTGTIPPGRAGLVVWPEGSTGSSDADPVNNPEVGEAIAAEAERIGAWMVVGGDRPVSETNWINANVVFSPAGEIVGEYHKQHPVPFGEYIPARPLFEWIPALDQVPRDAIPGDGPEVFVPPDYGLGTVISWEGGFARYVRETAAEGAGLIVVTTNQGSYGYTPASDQFIGMTRMRSAETGLDVIHAAVTGKSVVITDGGELGEVTDLATIDVLYDTVEVRPDVTTWYVRLGEWVMGLAFIGAVAAVVQTRSRPRPEPGA